VEYLQQMGGNAGCQLQRLHHRFCPRSQVRLK
jgi:hypothetical protein